MKTEASQGMVDRAFVANKKWFMETWGSEHANEALWTIQDSAVAEVRLRDLTLLGIGMEGCLVYADAAAIAKEAKHPHGSAGRSTEVTMRTGSEGAFYVDWLKVEKREAMGGNPLDETHRRFHAFRALRPKYEFREQWLRAVQDDDGLGSDGQPLCGPHGFSEELPLWLREPNPEWCDRHEPVADDPVTPTSVRQRRIVAMAAKAGS